MSLLVVDYAWGTPPYDSLKRAGVDGVMSYISSTAQLDPPSDKDLSPTEVREWWRRGVPVGLVFELGANDALGGYSLGKARAQFSQARAKLLGMPDVPVFYAVDWQATPHQLVACGEYIRGAAEVRGWDKTGGYGGYDTVDYFYRHNLCKWHWQTLAWSGGRIHPAAHLFQYTINKFAGGLGVDYNHLYTRETPLFLDSKPFVYDKGRKPPEPPKPPVKHLYGSRALKQGDQGDDVRQLQRYLVSVVGGHIATDGDYGPQTDALRSKAMFKLGFPQTTLIARDRDHSIGKPGLAIVAHPDKRPATYKALSHKRGF